MNLSTVTAGLATQVTAQTGLRCTSIEPSQVTPPAAWVTRATINYRADMGASPYAAFITLRLTVVMASGDSQAAQKALDPYLSSEGTKSILMAVQADPTLGGSCDFADVAAIEDVGLIEVGGVPLVGARFVIEAAG